MKTEQKEDMAPVVAKPGGSAYLALANLSNNRCAITGKTAAQAGGALVAIYFPIPREAAESLDWVSFHRDCARGAWGQACRDFDWVKFFAGSTDGKPKDPYAFVDDMRVNGRLLAPAVAEIAKTQPYLNVAGSLYSQT